MKKLSYNVLAAAAAITLIHKDGEKTETLDTREYDVNLIPAEINDGDAVRSLAAYGLSSLLQDRTSGIKDPAERLVAMDSIFEQLQAGVWRVRKEPGQRKATIAASLVEAVKRFFGEQGQDVTAEQVTEKLQSMDKEQRKALSNHPQIKAHRATYEAELAQAEMDEGNGEGLDISSLF